MYQKQIKQFYKECKARNQCVKCGSRKKLEYHHIDHNTKLYTVSHMVHDYYPIEEIQKEMDKCVVLCHRCHIKHHKIKEHTHT